jgi:hypothetical protein
MDDKRTALYNNLIKSGKVNATEIGGSADEFKKYIKDETSAREFYKNLMSTGRFKDELGSADDFYNRISPDFTPASTENAVEPQNAQDQTEEVQMQPQPQEQVEKPATTAPTSSLITGMEEQTEKEPQQKKESIWDKQTGLFDFAEGGVENLRRIANDDDIHTRRLLMDEADKMWNGNVKLMVDKAIEENKDAARNVLEGNDPTSPTYRSKFGGTSASAFMPPTARGILTGRAVARASDPQKVIDRVSNYLDEQDKKKAQEGGEGTGVPDKSSAIIRDRLMKKVYNYLVEQQVPQNSAEYILRSMFDSTTGQFAKLLAGKSDVAKQIEQEAMQRYNASGMEKAGAMAASVAADLPLMAVTGGIGEAAGATTAKLVARGALKRMAEQGVKSEVAKAVANRAIQQTGMKYGIRMASEAANFASLEGIGSAVSQMYNEGTVSPWKLVVDTAKGGVTGATMGIFGGANETVQRYMERNMGKALGKTLGYSSSLGGRTSILVGSSVLGQYVNNPDFDINDVDWTEEVTHAGLMNVGFDVLGAAKKFAAQRGMPKFNVDDVNLTKEEIRQLNSAGIEGNNALELSESLLKRADNGFTMKKINGDVEEVTGALENKGDVLVSLLENPNVDLQTKMKVAYLMTGNIYRLAPSTAVSNVEQNEDGSFRVDTFNSAGQVNESKRFKTADEAESYKKRTENTTKRNQVDTLERMMFDASKMANATRVFDIVAQQYGMTRKQVVDIFSDGRNGKFDKLEDKGGFTMPGVDYDREKKIYETIENVIKSTKLEDDYTYGTNRLKDAINNGYGQKSGWIDGLLKKDYSTLNETERRAVDDYVTNMQLTLKGEKSRTRDEESRKLLESQEGAGPEPPKGDTTPPTETPAPPTDESAPETPTDESQMGQPEGKAPVNPITARGMEMYQRHDPREMYRQKGRVAIASRRLQQQSGMSESDVDALTKMEPEQRQQVLGGMAPEVRRLAEDYLEQSEVLEGIYDAMYEAHGPEVKAAEELVAKMSPDKEGNVHVVPLGKYGSPTEKHGVVVGGLDSNGSISDPEGRVMVVPIKTDGKGHPTYGNFSTFDEANVRAVKTNGMYLVGKDDIIDGLLSEYNKDMDMVTSAPIIPGSTIDVMIDPRDPKSHTKVNVLEQTANGYVVQEEGSPVQEHIDAKTLQNMVDNAINDDISREYAEADRKYAEEQKAAEEARIAQEKQAEAEAQKQAEAAKTAEEQNQQVEVQTDGETVQAQPTNVVTQPAETQTPMSPIAKLAKYPEGHPQAGRPDYESSKPEDVKDYLTETFGGAQQAKDAVAGKLKELKKRFNAQRKKVETVEDNINESDFDEDEAAKSAEYLQQQRDSLATIQKSIDYWKGVNKMIKVPSAPRKRSNNRKPTMSPEYTQAQKEYAGNDAAMEILGNLEPQTAVEVATEFLSNPSVMLIRDEFLKETGYGAGDAKRFAFKFAGKDKGGISLREAGEKLMLWDMEHGYNLLDQNDPMAGVNAILEAFHWAEKPSDLRRMIERNRVEQARLQFEHDNEEMDRYEEEQKERALTERDANEALLEEQAKFYNEYENSEEYLENNANFGDTKKEDYERNGTVGGAASGESQADSQREDGGGGQGLQAVQPTGSTDEEGGTAPTGTGEVLRRTGQEGAQAGTGLHADGGVLAGGQGVRPDEGSTREGDGSATTGERIAEAEQQVNTNPTEAQKEAGNYKKGHVKVGSFDVTIENPQGSVRRGTDANGNKWETTMQNSYGYFRGTEGVDGDHIDTFLSNDIDSWNGQNVYVVDQYNEDGTFDEHKVMLGFNDENEARRAYLSNYSKDWADKHKVVVTTSPMDDFKKWIDSSHRKTKAFAEYSKVKRAQKELEGYTDEQLQQRIDIAKKEIAELEPWQSEKRDVKQGIIDRYTAELERRKAAAEAEKDVKQPEVKDKELKEADEDTLELLAEDFEEMLGETPHDEHLKEQLEDILKEISIRDAKAGRESREERMRVRDKNLGDAIRRGTAAGKHFIKDGYVAPMVRDLMEKICPQAVEGGITAMPLSKMRDLIEELRKRAADVTDKWNAAEQMQEGLLSGYADALENYIDSRRGMDWANTAGFSNITFSPDDPTAVYPAKLAKGERDRYVDTWNKLFAKGEAKPKHIKYGYTTSLVNLPYETKQNREAFDTLYNLMDGSGQALGRKWLDHDNKRAFYSNSTVNFYDPETNAVYEVTVTEGDRQGRNKRLLVMKLEYDKMPAAEGAKKEVEEKSKASIEETNKRRMNDIEAQYSDNESKISQLQEEIDNLQPEDEAKRGDLETQIIEIEADQHDLESEYNGLKQMNEESAALAKAEKEGLDIVEEASMPYITKRQKELKSAHNGALVLFRNGDFYACYGEDADTANKVLGATKTLKDGTPLVLFPSNKLDEYLPKLIRSGARVAISDEVENKRIAKKAPRAKKESGLFTGDLFSQPPVTEVVPTSDGGVMEFSSFGGLNSKTGEFAYVERQFTKSGEFSFTGSEKIESSDDVAYIFRSLENKAIENVFVVLVKDGVPTVVHIGMGSPNASPADLSAIRLAAQKAGGVDQVYMVHNHPSGNLAASSQDRNLLDTIYEMFDDDVVQPGIIIDTTSGKYGIFIPVEGAPIERVRPKEGGNVPLDVLRFDKQVFSPDFDLSSLSRIRSAEDVAALVSSQRLGDCDKISFLVLSNSNNVVANIHTTYSNLTNDNIEVLAKQIADNAVRFAGTRVVVYGDFASGTDSIKRLNTRISVLSGKSVRLLDLIKIRDGDYNSASEYGLLDEPEAKYGPQGVAEPAGRKKQDDDKSLVGVHNISEEKLESALKLGGLANPSAAVVDLSVGGHNKYGEISLVMPSSLVDKKSGRNAGTWAADAYTPRFPSTTKEFGKDGAKLLSEYVKGLPDGMDEYMYNVFQQYVDVGNSPAPLSYLFLHEKGEVPKTLYKEPKYDTGIVDALKKNGLLTKDVYSMSDAELQKLADIYADVNYPDSKNTFNKDGKSVFDSLKEEGVFDAEALGKGRLNHFQNAVNRSIRQTGKVDYAKMGEYSYEEVKRRGMVDEFYKWVADKEKEFGVKEMIYAGMTPSGTRKYLPLTLENISKIMKKQGRAGSESFFHDSPGGVRAQLSKKLDSLETIRKNKGRLVDSEKFGPIAGAISDKYFELANEIFRGDGGELADVLKAKDMEAVAESYGINLSNSEMKKLTEFRDFLKEAPTEYFETKFERPVGLEEFAAAVVPSDASADIKDALSKKGLQIYEYKRGDEADRKRALDEAASSSEDIKFSIRKGDAPKKTGIGYKVFALKDGKLYPPMVANPGGKDTPVGIWLNADAAPVVGTSKTGRLKVKAGGKGTQGGSGTLAYRPGWHLGEIPYALQFNRVNPDTGARELFPNNFVWAEVEYANDVDYQDEAMSYGMNPSGKFQHSLAGLPKVPENGSYRYRTNPNPETDPWIITGAMRVNKILTPSEVDKIVRDAGREPQPRQEGSVTDEQVNALNEQMTRGRFIGEKGAAQLDKAQEATTRMDNLNVAKDMEKSGKKAQIIKIATGWEKGADGKWRYETPDFKMKEGEDFYGLRDKAYDEYMDAKKAHEEIYKQLNRIDDAIDKYPRRGRTEAQREAVAELNKKRKEIAKQLEKASDAEYEKSRAYDASKMVKAKLSDWIEDEELFKAYPELADVPIEVKYMSSRGAYIPNPRGGEIGRIEMSNDMPLAQFRNVLVHEIQHAIQDIEGFAAGGNVRMVENARANIEWALGGLFSDMKSKGLGDWLIKHPTEDRLKAIKEFAKALPEEERENAQRAIKRLDDMIEEYGSYVGNPDESAYDVYRRFSGEVEARNAANRAGFSPENRRNVLGSETEDVAREDQIFIENALGNSNESLSLPAHENLEALNEEIDRIQTMTVNAPRGIVAMTAKDILDAYPNIDPVTYAKVIEAGKNPDALAIYVPQMDEIVMFPKHGTVGEIRNSKWHESFHSGFEKVFKNKTFKDREKIIDAAAQARAIDPELSDWIDETYKTNSDEEKIVHLMEKVVSDMQENGTIGKLKNGISFGDEYTELNEIANDILKQILGGLNDGKERTVYRNTRDARKDAAGHSTQDSRRQNETDTSVLRRGQGRDSTDAGRREGAGGVQSKGQGKVGRSDEGTTEVNNDTKYRFIGELGAARLDRAKEATTRLANLDVARQMERSGMDAKAIKMATGWERGADEKWRYEQPDYKRTSSQGDAHPERHSLSKEEYEELERLDEEAMDASDKAKEIYKRRGEDSVYHSAAEEYVTGGMDEAKVKRYLSLSKKYDELDSTQRYLDDYIDDDDLFKAYPELKDVKLNIEYRDTNPLGGLMGSYNPETNTITLYHGFDTSTLAHEIQHSIQRIEGFAKGGNMKIVKAAKNNIRETKKTISRLFESDRDYKKWVDSLDEDELNEMEGDKYDDGRQFGMYYRYLDTLEQNAETHSLREKLNNANDFIKQNLKDIGLDRSDWQDIINKDSYEIYERFAGETESRNVQERENMTPEQRRASLASETEDVAREEQIYRTDDDGGVRYSIRKPKRREGETLGAFAKRLKEYEEKLEAQKASREIENADGKDKLNDELSNLSMEMMAHPSPVRQSGESDADFSARQSEWEKWNAERRPEIEKRLNEIRKQTLKERVVERDKEIDEADAMYRGKAPSKDAPEGFEPDAPDSVNNLTKDEMREVRQSAEERLQDMQILTTKEQAKKDIHNEIIERRRYIDSSNLEDAIFVDDLKKAAGKNSKQVLKDIPAYIEGTYEGKPSEELVKTAKMVSDWFEECYNLMAQEGVLYGAPQIQNYVTHIWDWGRSPKEAQEKYNAYVNAMRMRSPFTRHRVIPSYAEGIAMGMVPKYDDITGIITEYGHYATETIANHRMVEFLKNFKIAIPGGKDNMPMNVDIIVSDDVRDPMYSRMNNTALEGYKVLNIIKPMITPVFGDQHILDHSQLNSFTNKLINGIWVTSSLMKKINLGFSFFHHGALTETAAAMLGPARAGKVIAKDLIWDVITKGNIPAMNNKEAARDAVKHLVSLGATNDYAISDVQNFTSTIRKLAEDKNIQGIKQLTQMVDFLNKGFDKVLWDVIHDGYKVASFTKMAKEIRAEGASKGWTEQQIENALDEAGQLVNDTFGGLHFDILGYSPKTVRIMRALLLSPDWTLATIRQALSPFGYGRLYNDDGVWNAMFKGEPASKVRRKYGRQFWLTAGIFFYGMMNGLNAYFRSADEENEKRKADEMRKVDPEYKSPYELAYPDGMKWYDYTMLGNTLTHQTHLFTGRYSDGTETYLRWGKQFRELPELFFGRDGLSFPGPMIDKMAGKANPLMSTAFEFISGHSLSGWENQDMKDKKGVERDVARLYMLSKKFLPYSIPTQEDKDFMFMDLLMPSSKGFTPGKAITNFDKAIKSGDSSFVEKVYNACVMNGLNPEKLFNVTKAKIEAEAKQNQLKDVETVDDAQKLFNQTNSIKERKRLKRYIEQQLGAQDYHAISQAEMVEKAKEIINGEEQATTKADDRYIGLSTSNDVMEDYRLRKTLAGLKKYHDDFTALQQDDPEAAQRMAKEKGKFLRGYKMTVKARSAMSRMKRSLGQPNVDDEKVMDNIRQLREQWKEAMDNMK